MNCQVASEFQVYEQASLADVACGGYDLLHAGMMWFYEFYNGVVSHLITNWMPHALHGGFLNILGMIGIAFLTIMIPIAHYILSDDSEKENGTIKYKILDRNAILDSVFDARMFLRYTACIFIPLFLWSLLPRHLFFYAVLLSIWSYGVLGMLGILKNTYSWMRGDKFPLRNTYLRKLSNSGNLISMKPSWLSYWEIEPVHDEHEQGFLDTFVSTIDKLICGNNTKSLITAEELIKGFNKFIDKRSIFNLTLRSKFFPKILEWHYTFWKKSNRLRDKDSSLWVNYFGLLKAISTTFSEIEKGILRKSHPHDLFLYLQPHVEKYKGEIFKSSRKEEIYAQVIIPTFFRTLVEIIEDEHKRNDHDIWEVFPPQWKVTFENVTKKEKQDSEGYVSRILWDAFWCWASHRIIYPQSGEYDFVLDTVSENLFPNTCPIMWSSILTFSMRGWSGSRIESLIEHPKIFGGSSKGVPFIFEGSDAESVAKRRAYEEERQKKMDQETIDLALLLYRFLLTNDFTEAKLKGYILELEGLKYKDESSEEYRRQDYLRIFKAIQQRRENL